MYSSTKICLIALVVITVLGQCTPALCEEPNLQERPRDGVLPEFPTPLPKPGLPITASAVGSGEFQLIGFTERSVTGDSGVLNYSAMCSERFPGARMCTVLEIMRTVNIPNPPGIGHAWVQVEEPRLRIHGVPTTRFAQADEPMDCEGWTSKSEDALGMSISLDPSSCYGGLMAMACNDPGVIACCGRMEEQQEG